MVMLLEYMHFFSQGVMKRHQTREAEGFPVGSYSENVSENLIKNRLDTSL
jgi:hypothetical protein